MNNNTSIETYIRELKEMYESNNRVLISIIQNYNDNFNVLINSLNNSNNEIKNNILNLLQQTIQNTRQNTRQNIRENTIQNIRENTRQNNSRQNNNRQNTGIRTNLFYNFWDPIEIYPTQTQIETATRIVRFGDIVSPLNTSCPISLEPFNENSHVSVIRYCNHIFNRNDLNLWFNSNCRCPVCRYDIREYRLEENIILSEEINLNDNILVDMSNNYPLNQINYLDISGNYLDTQGNYFHPPNNNLENRLINMDTNSLTEFLVSTLLNYPVPQASTTDMSGNLLRFFFSS
jgi:hypothetical protein